MSPQGENAERTQGQEILLRTADRLFDGFLERLEESNRNVKFAYFVQEVCCSEVFFGGKNG